MNSYSEIVRYLESLHIMPKTMPGLDKIKRALAEFAWYQKIDPKKVIVVAGTNGKGSTCAYLESLLLSANQKVGFYSSPHLISTTERIRFNGKQISEQKFVELFQQCQSAIKKFELSHFESLTLMAGHYYFQHLDLDFVIFEVGLGGTYDATNAFPHQYSVITKLGFDHVNILGNTIEEIAKNKFGIIQIKNKVVYHQLDSKVDSLKNEIQKKTNSEWFEVEKPKYFVEKSNEPKFYLETQWGKARLALPGYRSAENAMIALTTFEKMGFKIEKENLESLSKVNWPGRMQKVNSPLAKCPIYLSGDHNQQGIESLIELLKDYTYQNIHIIVGVGVDKDADLMLEKLFQVKGAKIYLTVTPFKGRSLDQYKKEFVSKAISADADPLVVFKKSLENATSNDLVLVTGSLYLVGDLLNYLK